MQKFTLPLNFTLLVSMLLINISAFGQHDICALAPAIFNGVTPFSTAGFTGINESSCGSTGDTNDGWFVYTATCTGDVTVSTCDDAGFDTTLAAYTGCAGTELACNDDDPSCSGNTSEMTFSVTSGVQYLIRIAGYSGATGTGSITISCVSATNDLCANAFVINDGVTAFSTVGFTGTNVTSCGGTGDTNDGWYRYTATCTGDLTVSTCGDAGFDTTLALFSGCGGTELACNDDDPSCSGNTSELTYAVTSGNEYWIRIAGYSGATGTGNITIDCASNTNDQCADAFVITDGVTAFSTIGFTGTNVTSCGGTGDTNDGWYLYTATCTGDLTVSTCGDASFDTTLAAFSSCGGTELACNDDDPSCSSNTSEMTFSVSSGVQYLIRVAGYSGATGTGNITIGCVVPAPDNDLCEDAISVGNPSTTSGTTVAATTTGAPPTCITTVTAGGVWYSYTSTTTEEVTVSLCGAPYDSKIGVYTGGCGGLACLIGEDDDFVACGGDDPSVTFVTTANFAPVTYFIYVHGYQTGQGTFNLVLSSILPVELASFEAEAMEDYNMLNWRTLSESNTEMHVIERSINGRDSWKEIGQVAAAGDSSDEIAYSLKDSHPLPSAYYRLKSVDFGGYTEYSEIIFLDRKSEEIEVVNIAPNPASTAVNVDFHVPEAGSYTIQVTNMVGQTMLLSTLQMDEGMQQQRIDVSALTNGVYFLVIGNGLESRVHKIVKQ